MIKILLILLFVSCTQKYSTYPVVEKATFKFEQEHNPITPRLLPRSKDEQYQCIGQWLFMNNAQTQAENALPTLLSHTCKKSDYLLDAKITNRWWTTLIYTRSCMIVEASCPVVQKQEE